METLQGYSLQLQALPVQAPNSNHHPMLLMRTDRQWRNPSTDNMALIDAVSSFQTYPPPEPSGKQKKSFISQQVSMQQMFHAKRT